MTDDTFRTALSRFAGAVPFKRFTVELVNGERLIGYHPEAFYLDADGLATYLEPDRTVQVFDAASVARLVSVVIPPGAH
jgi:hypothetical protein